MNKVKFVLLTAGILLALAFTFGCSSDSDTGTNATFVDSRDGKSYKYVKIGEQVWMAENLNYNAKRSKCYNDSTANCAKYGRLYYWLTAMGINAYEEWGESDVKHQGICPNGWHIPNNDDWLKLRSYVESNSGCRSCAGKHLKSKSGWNYKYNEYMDETSGNGTDEFGFSALPGGWGNIIDGFSDVDDLGFTKYDADFGFSEVGYFGSWWSSTVKVFTSEVIIAEDITTEEMFLFSDLFISYDNDNASVSGYGDGSYENYDLRSVRCLQD